eukprot:8236535-Lingulodinium_polyedra.AAC.1
MAFPSVRGLTTVRLPPRARPQGAVGRHGQRLSQAGDSGFPCGNCLPDSVPGLLPSPGGR